MALDEMHGVDGTAGFRAPYRAMAARLEGQMRRVSEDDEYFRKLSSHRAKAPRSAVDQVEDYLAWAGRGGAKAFAI